MAFPVALGGANLAAGAQRASDQGGLIRGARRVPVVSSRPLPRRVPGAFRARAAAEGAAFGETDEQRETRVGAEALRLVEYRLKKVLPAGMLDSVVIPPKLTEIRSFVRWEEAGKPENTSREWQVREYQAALVDLKLEILAGGTLNDVRRRYNLDTEFGEDTPLFKPTIPELQLLKFAADVVKEKEYYDPAKISALEKAEAEANARHAIPTAQRFAVSDAPAIVHDGSSAQTADFAENDEAVAALELAFETDLKDVGTADAANAVEEEEDLHKRIAAAADMVVARTTDDGIQEAEVKKSGTFDAAAAASVDEFTGEFGDDELAVLKARLRQEAEIAKDKARVKADAAKKVKIQIEALAAKAKAAEAKAAEAKVAEAKAAGAKAAEATAPVVDRLTPAQKKQREIAKAKAVAEAQLRAAREEMFAAKQALAAASVSKPDTPVVVAETKQVAVAETPVALKTDVPKPAFPPAPAAAAKPATAAYGVQRSATELEAKASAKRLAAAQADERLRTAALELEREDAAAEKRAAEADILAAKDVKRAANASAAAVARAVDERVRALESLHAKHLETLASEHERALVAARAAAVAERSARFSDSASASERLLRAKLSEAAAALEVSNEQCKTLKSKLARGREELEKVKTITAKAAEVLESRSADQRLIQSLKRELDVAVELEAAAEARAAAAEKTAAALKKSHAVPLGEKSSVERVAELEEELKASNEILAELKSSWEADRKVIALLSQMKDVSDESEKRALADAAVSAKDDSDLKSAGLWGLAKKYGKKTFEISSELWFGEGKDANAAEAALRASAAKRNNAFLIADEATVREDEEAYTRVGGSATVARLRAKANVTSDTKSRVRQMRWLASADDATDQAIMAEKTEDAFREPAAAETQPLRGEGTETVAERAVGDQPAAPVVPPVPAKTEKTEETPTVLKNNAVPVPVVKAPLKTTRDRVAAAAAAPKPAPKAWGASASATAPFTPSIVVPPASSSDDDKPKSSGWSSAHMPPGR